MDQYPIPQFIEEESRIASFISFRQFFYLVGAGILCFILYFVMPHFLFYLVATIIFTLAVIIAFVRIHDTPILTIVVEAIGFSVAGKDYTWQKKESPYPFKPIKRTPIKKIEEGPVLQAQTSQLKKTRTQVELHSK